MTDATKIIYFSLYLILGSISIIVRILLNKKQTQDEDEEYGEDTLKVMLNWLISEEYLFIKILYI